MGRTYWLASLLTVALSACGGPVSTPPPAEGRAIAFGARPSAREACFTCHGLEGRGGADAPRLAGQRAGYLIKQLEDYAAGTRPDAVMTPIAARLTARERRAVARYYASLTAPEPSAPALLIFHEGDPRRNLAACVSCHAMDARRQSVPQLGAQPADYTREQFRRWRYGVRRNDPGAVMGAVARTLRDDEIEALAHELERGR